MLKLHRVLLTLCMLLIFTRPPAVLAQQMIDAPDVTLAAVYRDAPVYAGPGETYERVGALSAGSEVTIHERNRIGNWLRVVANRRGLDGWVMTGYLTLTDGLRFSNVPENATISDADLNNLPRDLRRLYAAPVIPVLTSSQRQRLRRVYDAGQENGLANDHLTKVGDSVIASFMYLQPMANPDNVFGPYDYLRHVVGYYAQSAGQPSVAAVVGLSSTVVFDPTWADSGLCETGESPLDCEYRRKRPAFAFIAFGPNDLRAIEVDLYRESMTRIVEATLERGIIPILSTFTCSPEDFRWTKCVDFNFALVEVAAEQDVPLINFWAAARSLPNYGLDVDSTHLLQTGFRYLKHDTGHESWYGAALQNLLSIRTLYELVTTLEIEMD
ncbi:MAG: SH3 domain-containing protein [bacterium]|nr:SH3 domain-containing protein [bacterium]